MKRNILFVDDEQDILDGLRTMMHSKRKEWKTHFATSGLAALDILAEKEMDVVISDMRMPGMDGAEFLTKVSELYPGIIRMVLSGDSDIPSLHKAAKVAHQYLSKPCSSEHIIETIKRVLELQSFLCNDAIRATVTRLESLPVMPDSFMRITKELDSPEPNIQRLGKMVEKDVGITATLLKVVNSSFFGFYETVSSPTRAIALLGTEIVRGLMAGVLFFNKINIATLSGYSLGKLWDHSLQTGYFAKTIAAMESNDKDFIEECFLAGILHDVGKLIFITNLNESYRKVIAYAQEHGGPIGDCEFNALGVRHSDVGAYLLGVWGFKKAVVQAVFAHHEPEKHPPSDFPISHALIVHVANTLQHELKYTSVEHAYSTINESYLHSLGLEDRVTVWRKACREKWGIHED